MNILKKFLPFIIIVALSYFAVKPLFIPGFFPIHDDTQVQRVLEMKKSLSDGMLPVRWVKDLGYGFGYPIFNFYDPLVYYGGAFFMFFGFDALASTKIILGLSIILSGITMYLFAKEFWGRIGGIISGILYIFTPYHAINIFVRGDFAENLAYTFVPLVFLGLYKIYRRQSVYLWVVISSLSFAAIITSHNLTAMMVAPFFIVYAIVLIISSSKKSILPPNSYFLIFMLGALLSAFYWLPALAEMRYTNIISQIGGGADFKDHFACFSQLWESSWGFGGSVPGCIDGMSFRIGKIHIVLALISLVVLLFIWKKNKNTRNSIIFFIISFLLSVFLMLEISKPVWDMIPQMAYFQYPWRFLLLTSFTASFLGGSLMIFPKPKILSSVLGSAVIFAILFVNAKLFTPQTITKVQSSDFTNELNLKWFTSKISDEYLPRDFYKPRNNKEIPESKFTITNNAKINMLEDRTQQFSAKIYSEQNTNVNINLAYFPAWHVFLDNSEIPFKVHRKGLQVTVPKGEHVLTVKFIQTPIEKFANFLTFTGVIGLFIGIITSRKKELNGKKTT